MIVTCAVSVLLNVVLNLAMIYVYGFSGAVIGTVIAGVISPAIFILLFHRTTGHSYGRLVHEGYWKPTACGILATAIVFGIYPVASVGWGGLIIRFVVFGAVYVASLSLARFFDGFDLRQVETLLPAARFVRRIIRVT